MKTARKRFFLAQQHIEGQDLQHASALNTQGGASTIEQAQLVEWMCQILEVLDYLHHLQPPVIHRDVTPKNIIVRPDGAAFLVDFGSVQAALRSASEVVSTTAGTFGYAPMEQFVSAAFPSSDLYGLGMTMLAVASGKAPAQMPFRGVRVNVRELVPKADARLVLLLERMTEPDPERRLGDARIALEQLRPLRTRASSMSAVVDEHRKQHRVTERVRVSTDDLLPSERLREAATRLEGLSGNDLLQIPEWPSIDGVYGSGVSSDGSIVGIGRAIIDMNRMSLVGATPRGGGAIWAVSPNGEHVLTGKDGEDANIFARVDGKYVQKLKLSPPSPIDDDDLLRFSPDGKSLARVPDRQSFVELFDLRTGQQVQRLPLNDEDGRDVDVSDLVFSADGRWLAAVLGRAIRLFSSDGRKNVVKGRHIAFGADGATVAVFDDDKDVIRFGALSEHGNIAEQRKLPYKDNTIRHPRLSEDGTRIAFLDYSEDVVIVQDTKTGEVLHRFRDPARPTEKMRGVKNLAFSADGTKLIVIADVYFNRFATDDEDCVLVFSMKDGTHLGSIVFERGFGPVCVAASGHYGPLLDAEGKPAALPKKGERVGNGSYSDEDDDNGEDDKTKEARERREKWHVPLAANALRGEPIDALLDDKARAALADLDTRWAFLSDMRSAKSIDEAADQLTLVEATQGLTHLLDVVLRDARRAQADVPSFGGGGGGGKTPLTADQFVAAAKELGAKTKEEQRVLFDELLATAAAAEEARAKALPQPKAKKDKRGRQEEPEHEREREHEHEHEHEHEQEPLAARASKSRDGAPKSARESAFASADFVPPGASSSSSSSSSLPKASARGKVVAIVAAITLLAIVGAGIAMFAR